MTSTAARTPRVALLVVFVVALGIRLAMAAWTTGRGEMEGLSHRYEQDAYALVAGYGFSRPAEDVPHQVDLVARADSLGALGVRLDAAHVPAKDPRAWKPSTLHPPAYSAYLAGTYLALGPPMIPKARALQSVLDALACVLLFFVVRPIAGARAGVVAAGLAAVFLPFAYLATSRVADSLMNLGVVTTFLLWAQGVRSGRIAWFVGAGLVLGVACLLRPDWLLLPAFLAPGALAVTRSWRRTIVSTALLIAMVAAVLAPWGYRNLRAHGQFNIATHAGPMALYQGIGQFPNPYGITFDDDRMSDLVRANGFEGLDDANAAAWFRQKYLAIVREDPGFVVGQWVRRLPLGVFPMYRWGFDNVHYRGNSFYDLAREGKGPLRAVLEEPGRVLAAYWDRVLFGVIGFALFVSSTAFVFDRRFGGWGLALFLPYLYVVATHLPVAFGARLLLPAVFGQLAAVAIRLAGDSVRPPEEVRR